MSTFKKFSEINEDRFSPNTMFSKLKSLEDQLKKEKKRIDKSWTTWASNIQNAQMEIARLESDRSELFAGMEQEAEAEGGFIADRYAMELESIEKDISVETARLEKYRKFQEDGWNILEDLRDQIKNLSDSIKKNIIKK